MKIGKPRGSIGLDIGSSDIKYVELFKNQNRFHIRDFGIVKMEGAADEAGKALRKAAGRLSSKDVSISISGPGTVVRYIELPRMNAEELKSSMKFEAEKYIPFDLKNVILDCQVLNELPQGKMRVLLAAAKRDLIKERVKTIEAGGLSVKLIDCDSFALINAFLLNYPRDGAAGSAALIDIGEKLTTINILKGAAPALSRELELGGLDLAKAVSAKMGLDIKEASRLKENPESRLDELLAAARPAIARIIGEIKLSLTYYENQSGAAVERIFLSGGLSAFNGLCDMFREGIGVECGLWDPVKNLSLENAGQKERLDGVKNRLHVAVGLAVRK